MTTFSRVLIFVVVVLTILSQSGVSGLPLKSRRLSRLNKLVQTTHEQRKEASDTSEVKASIPVLVQIEETIQETIQVSNKIQQLPSLLPAAVPDRNKDRQPPTATEIAELNKKLQQEIAQLNANVSEAHESVAEIIEARLEERKRREKLNKEVERIGKQRSNPEGAWQDELKRKHEAEAAESLLQSQSTAETGLTVESIIALENKVQSWLQGGGDVCWKSTSQRGVGTIPNTCTDVNHLTYQAGLCYGNCPSSQSNGVGPVCWSVCPIGYTDIGALCSFSGVNVYGKGCCCTVFGCCHNCNSGYTDVGCLCQVSAPTIAKSSSGRGAGIIPTGCPSDRHNEAGLCYSSCPSGSVGLATTCWSQCTGTFSSDCGASCATSSGACSSAIFDMVEAPLMIVIDIATDGTLGTAIKSGVSVAKSVMETGVSSLVKAVASKLAAGMTTTAVQATIKSMANGIGKQLRDSAVQGIVDYAAHTQLSGTPPTPDLDMLTGLDPTGISNLILAYAHPIC